MKGSEYFLPRSHLCSHSHLGLCLCRYVQQQQGAIHVPKGYLQSLANVQLVSFQDPVLLLDIPDPYPGAHWGTRRDHGGRLQNHQLQFLYRCVSPYLNHVAFAQHGGQSAGCKLCLISAGVRACRKEGHSQLL